MRPLISPCRAAGRGCTTVLLAVGLLLACGARAAGDARGATYRQWLAEMKGQPRGPFSAIRWYCKDGAQVDPQRGDCTEHGGGIQHGEWSARTRELRAAGYRVGNLVATFEAPPGDSGPLQQLLIERFLVG
ncbi:MAG TPA: hypothetical protein VM369_07720, partial [Candidatus Binatia bacterium]|nr:hypothetical protein [Candidatus Binatia bacterium]